MTRRFSCTSLLGRIGAFEYTQKMLILTLKRLNVPNPVRNLTMFHQLLSEIERKVHTFSTTAVSFLSVLESNGFKSLNVSGKYVYRLF
jgi:hypothetical protein